MKESTSLGVINMAMALVFVVCAAVQFNDPDPLRWLALYALAAAACLLYSRLRLRWLPPALVGLASLLWAGLSAPRTVPHLSLRDLVRRMADKTPAIEESRELLGLLIVTAWMAVLVVAALRGKRTERDRRATGSAVGQASSR